VINVLLQGILQAIILVENKTEKVKITLEVNFFNLEIGISRSKFT